VVCGYSSPRWTDGNDVHHVLERRWLENHGFEHLAWDPRDGLSVCPIRWPRGNNCHGRHELSVERIPRSALTGQNEAFAVEVGAVWLLDRTYGERTTT
jgi:hypothetical protein